MKPFAIPPDAERAVIARLTVLLAGRGEDVTVGLNVPAIWAKGTKPHVQVGLDGTTVEYPVLWRSSVRITVWYESPTTAKRIALLCEALLITYGVPGASNVQSRTGLIPALDPDTKAQLASVGLFVNLRGVVQV